MSSWIFPKCCYGFRVTKIASFFFVFLKYASYNCLWRFFFFVLCLYRIKWPKKWIETIISKRLHLFSLIILRKITDWLCHSRHLNDDLCWNFFVFCLFLLWKEWRNLRLSFIFGFCFLENFPLQFNLMATTCLKFGTGRCVHSQSTLIALLE